MRSVDGISAHIASFLDFCRIEKGLSRTTVAAYHADLKRFAASLRRGDDLASPEPVRRYVDALYKAGMASRSIARHITTLRNLYGHLIEKGVLDADPTAHLAAPRQWQSLPKYLNKKQIDDLMASCDGSKPQGLRDRAMLEFLYATGLRVSELCGVRVSEVETEHGRGAGGGQGQQAPDRARGQGRRCRRWNSTWATGGRVLLKGRASPYLFVTNRGGAHVAAGVLAIAGGLRQEGRNFPRFDASRSASYVRHAPAGRRSGSEKPAKHAGALRYFDHPDLYACSAFAVAEDRGRASSESLNGSRVQRTHSGEKGASRMTHSAAMFTGETEAMSDYMFMLESHLSADQSRAVSEIQAAATSANLNVFLTGGAMRDMLGGFPMLDIDFTIEGNAIKVAQAVAKKTRREDSVRGRQPQAGAFGVSERRPRHHWHGAAGEVRQARSQAHGASPPPFMRTCAGAISPSTPSRCR